MYPFSAEKLLFHCFEKADQTGVEEIPHSQNDEQDFNSFLATLISICSGEGKF
jgi:hypothetical protein